MERYNEKIGVTKEDLTRNDDGPAVMSVSNYDKLVNRSRVYMLRDGKGLGRYALVEYSSLPERFRLRFEAKYGDPEELLRDDRPALVINAEARRYFSGIDKDAYRLPNGDCLPEEKIDEYTQNASVLDALLEEVRRQRLGRNRLKNKTRIIWENIYASSERMREEFGHTLPANIARLKDKLRAYEREGFEVLVSKKFCNRNTAKITERGGRLLIALRRSRVPVYTFEQIFEEYNRRVAESGNPKWKPLQSVNAVKAYLERPEVMPKWYAAVYGELAARQKFDRKQQTVLPAVRDALWYGDGTKLNLYYKGRDKDGRPVLRTTTVYEVIDAYSEMLLGYCICPVENADAQRKAFRMAVETSGHKPYEIVTDNQGGQKTSSAQAFMRRICRVSRRTAPHQPQAKTIEALFGRLQSQVLHSNWRFTGQNITAKSDDSRPNLEFIEANKDSLYTFEELCEAYAEYRQVWNDMRHPETGISRREMYEQSVNAEAPAFTQADLIDLFCTETEQPSEFTSYGIAIQVDGKRYRYEVLDELGMPDFGFRAKHTGRRFYVKYDPEDMTRVWLCTKSALGLRIVSEAQAYVKVHRAMQEQTSEEQAFLRATIEANKQARVRRQAEGYALEVEHGVAPEQHGLRTPRLQGLSRRDTERIYDLYARQTVPHPEAEAAEELPLSVGQIEKQISNMTFDARTIYNKL